MAENIEVYPQEEAVSVNIESGVVVFSGGSGPVTWPEVMNKPETFPPEDHEHNANDVSGLTTVAKTGSYNDLIDKPTTFKPETHSHAAGEVTGLAAVATSGSYNDLTDKPTFEDIGAANIVDGEAEGSLRAVGASPESDVYKLGKNAAAFGEGTYADGQGAFAEGVNSWAAEEAAHAEGFNTYSAGRGAHSEGVSTEALGSGAHAEGYSTHANAIYSHAEGTDTIASGVYQHVQGKFNVADTEDKYAHIVGNGDSNNRRSNAHTLDWGGNGWFKGDVYVGGTDQSTGDRLVKKTEFDAAVSASNSDGIFIVRYNAETGLADKTQAEIRAAVEQKIPCVAIDSKGRVYNYVGEEPYAKNTNMYVPTFRYAIDYDGAGGITWNEMQINTDDEMCIYGNSRVSAPNPKSLRLTGAVNATYDGSAAVTVEIPSGGSGSGGSLPEGGEPHQMLVTDGEGNAKWDERTHWKDEGLMDVLPETYAELDPDAGSFLLFEPFAMSMELGKTYVVTYNGETYTCVAKEFDMEGIPLIAVGNMGLLGGEESTEPFGLLVIPDEMSSASGGAHAMMMVNDGSTEATIQIQHDGVLYHKLDPGYMPFAMKGGVVDILPEITVNVDEMEDGMLGWTEPIPGEVVIGETYTVNYNGKTYTCTAVAFDMSDGEGTMIAPALGNIGASTGDASQITEEPFMFVYVPSEHLEMVGAYAMLAVFEDVYEHTFGIKGACGVKIDNSALDMDWIAKYDNVGETIVAETIGKGINAEVAATDTSFFVEGAVFVAYVDNVRYDLTVKSHTEGTSQTLYAGNLGLVTADVENTGEPFYIIAGDGKLTFFRAWSDDNGALHTIAVYLPGSSQRVPNQKIPEDFLSGTDVYYVDLADGEVNRNFDEIQAAYELGRTVCCREFDDSVTRSDIYYLTSLQVYMGEAHFAGIINGKMTEIKIENYNPDVGKYNYVTRTTIDLAAST